ncbi:MAG: type III toxin-antitoxin system ToxN/AbiQ family toxin [Lachnospiraceae bacterium]|nr:type III toxin-antitoxin system ToxN/AbiQ family toxin [Lachnospiraceae bacterium]
MNELKLHEISEEYISYISTVEKNVFSAKENDRNHTRKYLGIVYSINGYNYYIPLSSPKNSDYRMENGIRKIRRSIIPIIRITSQSSSGELELKGTLKLSNMIPVPASELTLYDIEHEPDLLYKSLIHKEMLFIRKNKNKIIQNAKILYKQKKENSPAIGYLKSTVDFSLLEQMHDKFIETKKN